MPEEDNTATANRNKYYNCSTIWKSYRELIFGDDAVTQASNDIERATDLAHVVTKWGLSTNGFISIYEEQQEVLGKSASQQNKNMSNETASSIDTESEKLSIHSTREQPSSLKTILIRCILWLTHL